MERLQQSRQGQSAQQGYGAFFFLAIALLVLEAIPSTHHYFTWVSAPLMLSLGLLCASLFGTPYPKFNSTLSKQLLQWSIVALGFGMNLHESFASGAVGMSLTVVSVVATLVIGFYLGTRVLRIDSKMSYLISAGTAICGGSAIAAVGPAIDADERDMSVALGTVFVLNAVALFIFPAIGRFFSLSQQDFGLWAAIAIHDTSSVVGAGAAYGEQALQTATMIKLTRALWIIPLALVSSTIFKRTSGRRIALPWFILFFLLAMVFNTYFLLDACPELGQGISAIGRRGMMLAMFAIGAALSRSKLQGIGAKPFLLGLTLWLAVSTVTLGAIVLL